MVSQTNFCAVSQQTVIKKDPLVPHDDANLSWFNTDILAKNQCLLRIFDAFFCKIAFDKFCFEFWLYFSTFWKKLLEKLSKADILAFVQLSTKLSISVKDFLKLSVILGIYRQNYRYRKWQGNYRKFIVIEKNDLSPTPNQEPVFPQVPRTKGYLGDTLVKLKVIFAILFAYNENPCCVKSIS